MIEFSHKYTLKNGNKVNKNNWHKVVAISNVPCTGIIGVPKIEEEKKLKGEYFEKWKLIKEAEGYIFREINHNCGINGHHKTYRLAIWFAIKRNIMVIIED